MGRRSRPVVLAAALALLSCGAWSRAEPIPVGYRDAVAGHGVSAAVFYAIALAESGQSRMTADFRPWPWTLSIDAQAHYFPDRESAAAALHSAIGREAGQLGVGLFQIEHRFHAHRFDSVETMLDPYLNARIAAEILGEGLHRSDGDLWEAIGIFHSSTPELADAYRRRVAKRLVDLIGRSGRGG